MREVPCDLCGSRTHRALFRHGRFRLVACSACGLAFLNPQPEPADLQRYYPDCYHAFHLAEDGGVRGRLKEAILRPGLRPPAALRWAAWLWRHHARTYPFELPPGRILDVGCGAGAFLLHMRGLGWEVAGIEPSAKACEAARARGLEVQASTVEDAALPDAGFDVVRMNHALEHLGSPRESLARLRRTLRPGGVLIAAVPDFGGWQGRQFKGSWTSCQIPTHLYHFSERTLRGMLDRAGFGGVTIEPFSSPSLALISLLRYLRLPAPVPFSLPTMRGSLVRALGITDELVARARA